MTIFEAINFGEKYIETRKPLFLTNPRLDALLLLAHTLNLSKENLLTKLNSPIEINIFEKYKIQLKKRADSKPLSYIIGKKEFFGLEFYVNDKVLIPRPESELLVEQVLQTIKPDSKLQHRVLDLCCGSGAVGISIKTNRPDWQVVASDISIEAGRIQLKNCLNNKTKVPFINSDLFSSIKLKNFDVIVVNPPYLTTKEYLEMAETGWPEPAIALDGGSDGLGLIKKIIKNAINYLSDSGCLLIEMAPWQIAKAVELLENNLYKHIKVIKDLSKRERVVKAVAIK